MTINDIELERRKAICRECGEFRQRDGVIFFCGRQCHRPDGAYCEPWAQQQWSNRLQGQDAPCSVWNAISMPDPYHTEDAYNARMAARREEPTVPTPFRAFYHVACIGNWREVVAEQAAVFERVKLAPVACVLGQPDEVAWVAERFEVISSSPDVQQYETPTLTHLWRWSQENPSGAVLYVHTKGVSAPHDANKAAWRKLMTEHLIEPWQDKLALLGQVDMVGADWIDGSSPHFSGNFWMARADWISHLPPPEAHRDSQNGASFAGNPWRRMHAEMWVGSRPWHAVRSLACRNVIPLWEGPAVFALNWARGDTIQEIYHGLGHRTDKGTAHSYIAFYDDLLRPLKDSPVSIVEIGVGQGGSLDLWDRYFTHPDARITGADLAVPSGQIGRIRTVQAHCGDRSIASLLGPIDVLIDDASHDPQDQRSAFEAYWPQLRPGGLYVVEDLRDDAAVQSLLEIHPFTEVDLRSLKGRFDDRILWARKPQPEPVMPIHLGTAVTEDDPGLATYLDSLHGRKAQRFCVCFGFWPSLELRTRYPGIRFAPMPRTCIENYGMIPWGAWLDAMPEIDSDALCCITNADMVIQRDFTEGELKRFQDYDDRTIGMGVNAGPDDTLADEAARIGLARDEAAYPGDWSAIPLYNCGVMIARAGLFRKLRWAYVREAEGFYQRTAHRARCQWLIGYLLHRLGIKVDLLGPEVHTNGHFGLPAGCRMEGGVCRYGDQAVMFRHHL